MSNYKNDHFNCIYEDNIAIISINQINEPTNLFSLEFLEAYFDAAKKAIDDSNIKGIIVTSDKNIFMAGGDLRMLSKPVDDPEAFYDIIMQVHQKLRTLETASKPIVAAINGTCLGGGYELALTCHHRIAIDSLKIKIGLPEAKVGLLPGGGGTSKLPYLCGIQNGLTYLLQGKEFRPQDALKADLIDELAANDEELIHKAKGWIINNPKTLQKWDDKKYRIPGGSVWTPNGVQTFIAVAGNVSKLSHGNYPAQKYITQAVYEGLQVPIDRALEIEARYFTKVVGSKEAKNIMKTGFFAIQSAKKGIARPKEIPESRVNKVGIIGAGMMGAGVAYVSAKAGIESLLKDTSMENAEKGKAYSKVLLDNLIAKNRSNPEKASALLDKIIPVNEKDKIAGSDLIIEAVFEDPVLKDKVIKETEILLNENAVYASNTSTIPISLLAGSSSRPENFIGIHFFSPVEKMPLVEIIVGKKTSDQTIAKALDYCLQIGKIPIVVNDSRGFFTSRCFGSYVSEGMFLLEEGVPAAMIENIAKKNGMPVGPLAVHDEVSLSLTIHVFNSNPDPKTDYQIRANKIAFDMVENEKRSGKKAGAGFYDYPQNGKKRLWKGLTKKFNSKVEALSEETIANRLLHFQALESYRCLEEGVLNSATDGDLGSVLGWGFPIYTGGALSYIDYYGINNFIKDCDDYSTRYGSRFEIPGSLRTLASNGKSVFELRK